MANSAAKKLAKANAARLQSLRLLILATNGIFGAVRAGLFMKSFRFYHGVIWAVFIAIYGVTYGLLSSAAKPTYRDGKLVDGGEDISKNGFMEYVHDLMYVTAFTQVLCVLSDYALLIMLVIPIYAAYAALASRPSAMPAEELETEQTPTAYLTRKERRKQEREARKH